MQVIRRARILGPWLTSRMNLTSERAATAVEYGIMVMMIAVVVIVAVFVLGNRTSTTFDCTATSIGDKGATKC